MLNRFFISTVIKIAIISVNQYNADNISYGKIVVLLNYKDGEKCVRLDELNESTKKTNALNECSPSFKFGDPYGN